ncbi:type III secretion system chaperone [Celeribacter sp.]|uniref:type III secretion system chaperone n=1 Tax=Celeribacter sp. TaxID=1890673 RepID=UPI003A9317CA
MKHDTQFRGQVNTALEVVFAENVASFALDADGLVTIGFEADGGEPVDVTLQADAQARTVLAWAEICRAHEAESRVILRALKMNFFALSPTGAFIAYDPARAALQLCYETGERVARPEELDRFLGAFVAGVEAARRALRADVAPTPAPLADEMGALLIRG